MKQANNWIPKITLVIATAISIVVTLSAQAQAQQEAAVYVQSVEQAEGRVVVDVIAENVTDMYGAEFQLRYDPAVFSVQDADPNREGIQIEPGSLLPADKGFVVANQVNEAEGLITFALTLLNPAPPATGTGPLARVSFTVLQNSPSTLEVTKAKLVAVNLQTIPSTTTPLAVGGIAPQPVEQQAAQVTTDQQSEAVVQNQTDAPVVSTEASPAAAESGGFPWWIVAVGVMVIGVVGLGALILLTGNLSQPQSRQPAAQSKIQQQPRPAAQQQVPQPQQPRQASGTRPSAFK